MKPGSKSLLILALAVLTAGPLQGVDLFVDQANGADGNDGLSWATARATVGSAVATAEASPGADSISVAAGRYVEQLVVPADTALFGGFPPGGGTRDPAVNPTVLDGDGAFAPVVTFPAGSDGTVLDGFVVRGAWDPDGTRTGGIRILDAAPLIRGNIIEGNHACLAGVSLQYTTNPPAVARIEGNVIRDNTSPFVPNACTGGRAIWVNARPDRVDMDLGTVLAGNRISSNRIGPGTAVEFMGRGRIESTIIEGNEGRGMRLAGEVALFNVLIVGNESSGLLLFCSADYTAESLTVAGNGAEGITVVGSESGLNLQVNHSILWGHDEEISVGCGTATGLVVETSIVEGGLPGGAGIIEDDPLFVPGPSGDHYLSQTAAGQPVTSPAVDAGTVLASDVALDVRTTRTDSLGDAGTLDLGFHYEGVPSLTVTRGTRADALTPHRTVASLPFVDDPGTLSDPGLPLLFYRVPEAMNELFVTKDLAADAPELLFR